jgi:hypothetical protein
MDAIAQLALMAKAKRVFESDTTFLSFPALSPLSYLPEALRFGSATEMTADDLREESEFARTANQLPRSVIAPVYSPEYLWDVYRDVLETARLATPSLAPVDSGALAAARSLLYATDADGLRIDSDTMRTYKQHRDAVIKAHEEFRNQQLTAETSTDPAVQARWKDEDEPRLREGIRQLEDAWVSSGSKAEVEAAQQVEQAAAAVSPISGWSEWRSAFQGDLDLATDTNQIRFAITSYSPYDIFSADDWPRFTLSGDEIRQLAEEAPAELREIFAGGSGGSEIESLSFEYRSVSVTRPWLRPNLFTSRFWRLPDGAEPLSDGQGGGRCPAYICALVFARNVTVKHREQSGGNTAIPVAQILQFEEAALSPMFVQLATDAQLVAAKPPEPLVATPLIATAAVQPMLPGRASLRLRATAFGEGALAMRVAAPIATPTAAPAAASAPATRLIRMPRGRLLAGIEAVGPPAQPAPEPAPPPPAPPAPERVGEVMILAFICKRIGRSPDPDPALSWG